MFTMFRETIQENVDMIKLQREVKEKASKLQAVESKYLSLNEVYGLCKFHSVFLAPVVQKPFS